MTRAGTCRRAVATILVCPGQRPIHLKAVTCYPAGHEFGQLNQFEAVAFRPSFASGPLRPYATSEYLFLKEDIAEPRR